MSYSKMAKRGESYLNKRDQRHQMPVESHTMIDTTLKNTVYGVPHSIDRVEHIEFIRNLCNSIDCSSSVNVTANDPFIVENIQIALDDVSNVTFDPKLTHDIEIFNSPWYERSPKATDKRTGSALAYDTYVKNSVKNLSGKHDIRGPYTSDMSWIGCGGSHMTFRGYLLGAEFGLKKIKFVEVSQFDSDQEVLEVCIFYGEKGYTGDVFVENKDGTVVVGLPAELRPTDKTKKSEIPVIIYNEFMTAFQQDEKNQYKWSNDYRGFSKSLYNNLEIKDGNIRILRGINSDGIAKYIYSTHDRIKKVVQPIFDISYQKTLSKCKGTPKDPVKHKKEFMEKKWNTFYSAYNSDNSIVATRSGPAGKEWYDLTATALVKSKTIVPGGVWFNYIEAPHTEAKLHVSHLRSAEVSTILKNTRKTKGLSVVASSYVPRATKNFVWTPYQKKILAKFA
jgi:hypothetical protein